MESKNRNSKKSIIIAIISTAIVIILVGILMLKLCNLEIVNSKDYDEKTRVYKKFAKMDAIVTYLDKDFLWGKESKGDPLEPAYRALLGEKNDHYTRYLNKEEREEFEKFLSSSFVGVGVVINKNSKGQVVVVDLIKDGPAMASGVQKGDIITAVDGKKYEDMSQWTSALRGKIGTSVKITVDRKGSQKEFSVVRGEIKEANVQGTKIDNLGYIRIQAFGPKTAEAFKGELKELMESNIKGLIIDLRGNPGGLLEEGLEIADYIVPSGELAYTKDKKGKKEVFKSKGKGLPIPYVVLVDGNTASTAEVLASAIKYNKSGTLLGTKTFGKGIIQENLNFEDGTSASITVKEYFSPDNKVIHKVGVTPDVIVDQGEIGTDNQMAKAVELLNSQIKK